MNAVEIEEAVSELAGSPFDAAEFPYAFLRAFGNKETTLKRLRSGQSNSSDIPGGVLQRNNIHIGVCADGMVTRTLAVLRENPKTTAAKAKFVLATDGVTLEAEELATGETIAPLYHDFGKHFGFFLPLAGISTVKEIKNNPFDIKATGRLNKMYIELLKDNPDWATEAKRPALNQFIARLIFCFFAEDTGIFLPKQFTKTLEQMSDGQSGNTREVLCELFRAMDLKPEDREAAKVKNWANVFPYVNGGMFAGGAECPKFSRLARTYLLHVGNLEWDKINPDIFGSMIQAVADDDERGEIGMHYTSVPNILKVLNPLFLDDLREQLKSADNNLRKLRNLRKRLSSIRVFDPACGSGNFLVIAYKEMRAIEHEIVKVTGEEPKSWIKLENFYGIEIKNFAVEIARLALLIAEFQCDVQYISQHEARAMVLPLHRTGQIRVGNALRLGWMEVCPPVAKAVLAEHDLGGPTGRLALEENGLSESLEAELYICGNPPYVGDKFQTAAQKADLRLLSRDGAKAVDYVAGWLWKASDHIRHGGSFAFVSTNSICQGVQVPLIWPVIFENGQEISFAHKDFYWSNNASNNANVICVIVGLSSKPRGDKFIYFDNQKKLAKSINAYLIDGPNIIVGKHPVPISDLPEMVAGNIPRDKGQFMMSLEERDAILAEHPHARRLFRKIVGSFELINGIERTCLWIEDDQASLAASISTIANRLDIVRKYRETGSERGKLGIGTPFKFERTILARDTQIVVPRVFSERRPYVTADYMKSTTIVSDAAQAVYDAPLHVLSIISSRMHLVWIGVTAGRMKSDFRYSSGVCYNSFPIPKLTEKNIIDLTTSAENILLARETHFPATLAELYDPEFMPDDLRRAHEVNDDIIERIYIGRRFRNDSERLEKLFDLYTKMVLKAPVSKTKAKRGA